MTISLHPDDETLARHAAGMLAPAQAVVIATHVSLCPQCADAVADLEAVGGGLLATVEPVAMAADALERTLAQLGRSSSRSGGRKASSGGLSAAMPEGVAMPAAIAACDVGPWRWVGPGVRIARVRPPEDPDANLVLLRVAAGRRLPRHTHSGRELTQVLYGSFSDERGRYRPGDIDMADADVHHQPVVDAEGECICLAAIDGRMRPDGFISRALQPFFGL